MAGYRIRCLGSRLSGRIASACALVLVLALFCGLGTPAAAADKDQPATVTPQRIIIQPPAGGQLTARIWVDRASYAPGDPIVIHFSISKDAYVYILDLDTEGVQRLLLPNSYEGTNFFRAGTYSIPRANYSLKVQGPPGTEYLQIVAATKPVKVLEDLRVQFSASLNIPFLGGQLQASIGPFSIVENPVDLRARIEEQLHSDPTVQWTTAYTSFQVTAPGVVLPPPNRAPVAQASANPSRAEVGQSVSFDASNSYDPDGFIANYFWDLNGDGINDASGMKANWRYDRAGTYHVRLQVTDNQGAVAATTITVQVVTPATVRLEISSSPSGANVYLDGVYLGRTPVRVNTTPGWHQLRVTRSSDSWETQINLSGLESLELDVSFD
ncbi:MAG: DUF4384 domain-containing protein [Limnochordales bacterium]|nr:DUF4384 domain-containing protein [Limnochordales bacterium]